MKQNDAVPLTMPLFSAHARRFGCKSSSVRIKSMARKVLADKEVKSE